MNGKTIEELHIGDSAKFTKTISESDIYLFAGITGDMNPVHINEEYAKTTIFKSRIVHGMLLAGLISTVLGNYLPGPGTIYISQKLQFLAPVIIGDTITSRIEIVEIYPGINRVRIWTGCFNQDEKLVLDGEAIVSPPKG